MSISGVYFMKMRIPTPAQFFNENTPPEALEAQKQAPPEAKRKWPEPPVIRGSHPVPDPGFFDGDFWLELTANEDGSLEGFAGDDPILSGSYTGEKYFTVDFDIGHCRWKVTAAVAPDGAVEGFVHMGNFFGSVGEHPNLAYGQKLRQV